MEREGYGEEESCARGAEFHFAFQSNVEGHGSRRVHDLVRSGVEWALERMNGQGIAENPLGRITIDGAKRSGQPCIRGLRITVRDILEYLSGGMTESEILGEFPDLEREDFTAVYAYAARELA